MPSVRVLAGNYIRSDQHKRIVDALRTNLGSTVDASKLSLSECLAIVREVYSLVAAAGKANRVDIFNGNYGLMRGLAASALVLLLAAIVTAKSAYVIAALVIVFLLALQRMHRFGKHYAIELFVQFLTVTGRPVSQDRTSICSE
jgi:hypothetical protein